MPNDNESNESTSFVSEEERTKSQFKKARAGIERRSTSIVVQHGRKIGKNPSN